MNINNRRFCDENLIVNAETLDHREENSIVKMKTVYRSPDEEDESELTTKAVYRKRGSLCQIIYQDSETTGFFDGETKITAESDRLVSILRRGHRVGSDLMIQCDRKLYSQYETPLGSVCIGVLASQIDNHLDSDGGTLHMVYTIDINGSLVSENEIYITVELL